jgi:hypothetical protein
MWWLTSATQETLSAGGGCELAVINCCKCAWIKFRVLLPILTNRQIPLTTRCRVYSACVRSVMLYGSETWAISMSTQSRLVRNKRAMLRWMYGSTPDEFLSTVDLLTKVKPIKDMLRSNRLRWFGHVEHSTGWISQVRKIQIPARKTRDRPKLSWDQVESKDRASLDIENTNTNDRSSWRNRLHKRLDSQATPSLE